MYHFPLVIVLFWTCDIVTLSFGRACNCSVGDLKNLEKINNEVSQKISYYKTENEKLENELEDMEKEFEKASIQASKYEEELYTILIQKIESYNKLVNRFTKVKEQEVILLKDRDIQKSFNLALTLKIKHLSEDIEGLERRRQNGEADMCFNLQQGIQVRSLSKPNPSKPITGVILGQTVERNKIKLKYLISKNQMLQRALKDIKAAHEQTIHCLNCTQNAKKQKITQIEISHQKMTHEMNSIVNRLTILRKELCAIEVKNKKSRDTLVILESKSKEYNKDRSCYEEFHLKAIDGLSDCNPECENCQ